MNVDFESFKEGMITKMSDDGGVQTIIIDKYDTGETLTLNSIYDLVELLDAITNSLKKGR